ncbi:MAG: hypothetical protein JW927_18440 [Deltaproteobacteria bacterium]|nr:hypothetical protein [Deltaproteobacteria bacterium]
MLELNAFQKKCWNELSKKLRLQGIDSVDVDIKESKEKWYAVKEIYLEASIGEFKIWIYEDGTHIKGEGLNVPFEALDYKNEDDLIHAFLAKLLALLKPNTGVLKYSIKSIE